MEPQSFAFGIGQLEIERGGKPLYIPFHSFVQYLGFHLIKFSQVFINDDLFAPYRIDKGFYFLSAYDYLKIPQILSFTDENGVDNMKQEIEANYKLVKLHSTQIVESEMERIKNDPDLQHLVQHG